MVPPAETVQVQPVIPDSLVYIFPAEFAQTEVVPVMPGSGKVLTVPLTETFSETAPVDSTVILPAGLPEAEFAKRT